MSSLIGFPFLELLTVDSTNNYAMGRIHEGMAQHGLAVFAHEQTRGRGQRNRHWFSKKNENIALSVVLDPQPLSISRMFLLSQTMAVAALQFLNRYVASDLTIKWPNDLYWCDRKAGGILIENVLSGTVWKYAVAGIGINVNQTAFEAAAQQAVSIKQITGRHYPPVELAKAFCQHLQLAWESMMHQPQAINELYLAHLYKRNQVVRLKKDNRVFEATITGVNAAGQLVVQTAVEEYFNVGEVTWLI